MLRKRSLIIYSDLDGTFLDYATYSFEGLRQTLLKLEESHIPLVFCSSKTRVEIESLQRQMGVTDPFICENGGAICVPRGTFSFDIDHTRECDNQLIIELGASYAVLVEKLHEVKRTVTGQLKGFHEMTIEEVAADCGLSLEDAARAKQREYSEPFKILADDSVVRGALYREIRRLGLTCTRGGRYYHLLGGNDKALAVDRLNGLYRQEWGDLFTVGLGDSPNDLPLLQAVDLPILVKLPDGRHDPFIIEQLPHVKVTDGIGPSGWREAVEELLSVNE